MTRKPVGSRSNSPPRQRRLQPKQQDPYANRQKAGDVLVCDECHVVGHGGRWFWGEPPAGTVRGGLCPACQRVRDRYPAGTLRVAKVSAKELDDLLNLLRSVEAGEKQEHPLERIMAIDEIDGGLTVTTTGVHMARCLAGRLERQFHRQPKVHYGKDNDVRIEWS